MKASRVLGTAPASLDGVCAGSIDSNSGKASVTPVPRKNVRRERCFLLMKFISSSSLSILRSHLKRLALHNTENERRKTIIVACRLPNDVSDGGHVVGRDRAPRSVSQQLFRSDGHKHVGPIQQRPSQARGAIEPCAIHHFGGGIDAGLAVVLAPLADQVEILEREADGIHDAVAGRAYSLAAVQLHALAKGCSFACIGLTVQVCLDAWRRRRR